MVLSLTVLAGAQRAPREQVIYSFSSSGDCFNPIARMVADPQGNLYGTTYDGSGSESYAGCVFELSPNADGSWSENTIHFFDVNNGYQPVSALVFDKAGNLYGTAAGGGLYGGGVVFELSPAAGRMWTDSVLYDFGRSGDGVNAATEVVFGPDGSLYGATEFGGSNGCGIVYRLSPALVGWSETILHDFANSTHDGCNPRGGLIFDSRGRLYGTTAGGGAHGFGTVYELTPSTDGSYREHLLHSFSGSDGATPISTLAVDQVGNLYGTTFEGGNGGYGTVFELTASGGQWRHRVLYAFSGNDGENPVGPVILDREGTLYAAAAHGGGTNFNGLVFALTPEINGPWREMVLHRFSWPSTRDGAAPYAGLILHGDKLFGTTLLGGTSNRGAVVSIGH